MIDSRKLIDDAVSIWKHGIDAVRGDRVIREQLHWDGRWLTGNDAYDLRDCHRIVVVGAGKAVASMMKGLDDVFQSSGHPHPRIEGWLNVPEGTIPRGYSSSVTICEARPAGLNEPTDKALLGARQMMNLVRSCQSTDFVITLLSGGGSALLPLPIDGISLDDKRSMTRWLSAGGANISELNTVRRAMSKIKAGGLARACRASHMLTLIISDVLGDSLSTIASGPTFLEDQPDPFEASKVIDSILGNASNAAKKSELDRIKGVIVQRDRSPGRSKACDHCRVEHFILANNASAVDAAGQEAVRLGYAYWMQSAPASEGDVEWVANQCVEHLRRLRTQSTCNCVIWGGEPTVKIPDDRSPRKGGRNQQLVLSVMKRLIEHGESTLMDDMVLLSGGSDGEDGPTDAAGAWLDQQVMRRAISEAFPIDTHWKTCNAYPLFEQLQGLFKTGPTETNVCDLRVILKRSADTEPPRS